MNTVIERAYFNERIDALLRECELPTEDLSALSDVILFSCTTSGELRGIVGLELYGTCGLLRSLAVAPGGRGEGVGGAMLAHAEMAAAARGVKELYLLTTTAERYFTGRGYSVADRAHVPVAIATTQQFSNLCPSSSAFMIKRL